MGRTRETGIATQQGVPRWHALIEPLVPIFLAVHGTGLLWGVEGVSAIEWALIGVTALLGVFGLAGWRSPTARVIRAWSLVGLTLGLLVLGGGAAAFFTLWYFLIAPVYALALRGAHAYAYPVVIGGIYLVLGLVGETRVIPEVLVTDQLLPTPVLWGRVTVITGTGLLVAALSAAQRRAFDEAAAARNRLIASVSHELRTPLTAVVGFTAELRRRTVGNGDPELAEFAHLGHQQATEVAHIVEDLLVAARNELDEVQVSSQLVDVHAAVAGVVGEYEQEFLEMPSITGDATAIADPIRVRQILRNLVANALRYGGPNIEIRIDSQAGRASVEVVDDGDGVPTELVSAMFQPFQRGHDHTGQPGSIGLGLWVSRTLAELMGGSLRYRRLGHRTAFTLELPLAVRAETPERR